MFLIVIKLPITYNRNRPLPYFYFIFLFFYFFIFLFFSPGNKQLLWTSLFSCSQICYSFLTVPHSVCVCPFRFSYLYLMFHSYHRLPHDQTGRSPRRIFFTLFFLLFTHDYDEINLILLSK